MCMSPSSLGNCSIYSTWCIMICLVIPILPLLLFIQSLYSLSKLLIYLSLVLFLLLFSTYHYNILFELVNIRSKGLRKQLYFPGAKPIRVHWSTACALTSTMASELKGLIKEEILQGRKHISMQSCIIT